MQSFQYNIYDLRGKLAITVDWLLSGGFFVRNAIQSQVFDFQKKKV